MVSVHHQWQSRATATAAAEPPSSQNPNRHTTAIAINDLSPVFCLGSPLSVIIVNDIFVCASVCVYLQYHLFSSLSEFVGCTYFSCVFRTCLNTNFRTKTLPLSVCLPSFAMAQPASKPKKSEGKWNNDEKQNQQQQCTDYNWLAGCWWRMEHMHAANNPKQNQNNNNNTANTTLTDWLGTQPKQPKKSLPKCKKKKTRPTKTKKKE